MRPGQSLSQLTARLLIKLEARFKEEPPDIVLAHGDTTTCFAAAVSSFYHRIPFLHVEAGLRTYRLNSPFPEEFNRQTVAPIATHHFAPTELEKSNLIKDGISSSRITVSGTTIHDALSSMVSKAKNSDFMAKIASADRPIVTVTLHRRESAQSIERTLAGIRGAALEAPRAVFVCPVHPNPSVKAAFRSALEGLENVILTDPLGYPAFVALLMRTQVVVTDSGGVQEEAAFLGKTVLLARSETERADGLGSGLVRLVGREGDRVRENLVAELSLNQGRVVEFSRPSRSASEIIVEYVERIVG